MRTGSPDTMRWATARTSDDRRTSATWAFNASIEFAWWVTWKLDMGTVLRGVYAASFIIVHLRCQAQKRRWSRVNSLILLGKRGNPADARLLRRPNRTVAV